MKGKAQIEQLSSTFCPYLHFSCKGALVVTAYTVVIAIANTAQSVAYHCQLDR